MDIGRNHKIVELQARIDALGGELLAIIAPSDEEMRSFCINAEDAGHCDGCVARHVYEERIKALGNIPD